MPSTLQDIYYLILDVRSSWSLGRIWTNKLCAIWFFLIHRVKLNYFKIYKYAFLIALLFIKVLTDDLVFIDLINHVILTCAVVVYNIKVRSNGVVQICGVFSSPELKAQVSFSGPLAAVVCLSVRLSVRPSVNFLLQKLWANFNQTWQKTSLGEGDSSLFKWRAPPFSKASR